MKSKGLGKGTSRGLYETWAQQEIRVTSCVLHNASDLHDLQYSRIYRKKKKKDLFGFATFLPKTVCSELRERPRGKKCSPHRLRTPNRERRLPQYLPGTRCMLRRYGQSHDKGTARSLEFLRSAYTRYKGGGCRDNTMGVFE